MARHGLAPRVIYHVVRREDLRWDADDRYRAASLATEGFVHASYREEVAESAALYFPAGAELLVLAIDEKLLDVPVEVVDTPRGPMPHVRGPIPRAAVRVAKLAEL